MDIKLLLFDLDGVLVDSRDFHYSALNMALAEVDPIYSISRSEHLNQYDGLMTREKLAMLTETKGLPIATHDQIWHRKQALTAAAIDETVRPSPAIMKLFKQLKQDRYKVYVCSNSIRATVEGVLSKMGLRPYIRDIISNQDVSLAKPHPEMYWQAMIKEQVLPKQTLIIEDSYVGRTAALSSGANLCSVQHPRDVTIDRIYTEMRKKAKPKKWEDKKLTVLIPMAGAGSRFAKAGYTFPKPLIEVNNQPMIKTVVDNLNVDANFIFVVQKEHYDKYNLKSFLNMIAPNCSIIIADGLTDGACRTTLLAKHLIDNDRPLLIANSDQLIKWESGAFFHAMNARNIDGAMLTFESTHPKWSYVRLDPYGNVAELREKEVISSIATVGVYYWSKGSDYVKYSERMILKNKKVKGEFYVAPAYNEAVEDGKIIKTHSVDEMWGLGTPEDLDYFLQRSKDGTLLF